MKSFLECLAVYPWKISANSTILYYSFEYVIEHKYSALSDILFAFFEMMGWLVTTPCYILWHQQKILTSLPSRKFYKCTSIFCNVCYLRPNHLWYQIAILIPNFLSVAVQDSTNQKPSLMKRLTRNDNKRYHTTGIVDDIKVSQCKKFIFNWLSVGEID